MAAETQLNATTVAAAPEPIEHGAGAHVGFNSPGVWVALSMIVVIALLVWKKAPAAIGAALDKKIAAIKAQLDEASKLRAEAEALKTEYEGRARAASGEAAAILTHAQAEAAAIVAKARDDAEALVARRGRMAEDKIAAAERAAIADLRAKAARVAAAAAADLIARKHDGSADKSLVDRTIAGLGQRSN